MNDNLIAEGPNHAAALALLNDLMLVLSNASCQGLERYDANGGPVYAPYVSRAIESGQRIAVVFRNRAIVESTLANGESFMGLPVVDGDDSDIRHRDPKGAIVALYAKGKAKRDNSGFVVG